MKAVIKSQVSNGRNYGNEKELVDIFNVVGKVNGELRDVVCCRAYMGRSSSASVVYASIWVHSPGVSTSGKGSAGGGGYHKVSAAIGDAISSAGIELYGDVYEGSNRYCYAEKRAYTDAELKARSRKAMTKRAHIGGVGDSAIESALFAIAKAAGAKGKLLLVRN
jgi:hypothetical protein